MSVRKVIPLIILGLLSVLAGMGCRGITEKQGYAIDFETRLTRGQRGNIDALVSVGEVIERGGGEEWIRLAMAADESHMAEYLRVLGYYDSLVTANREERDGRPFVRYRVDTGPLYTVDDYTLVWPPDHRSPRPGPAIRTNAASAAAVLGSRASIIRSLQEKGYPRAEVTNMVITVDHATRTLIPRFEIDPGPVSVMGPLEVEGLRKIEPGYIDRLIPWQPGDPYDVRSVELLEKRLTAGGLFSSIVLRPMPAPATEPPSYPLSLTLRERKPRTLQFGVGYRTDTGAELSSQWQHRNTFGYGEDVTIGARITEAGWEGSLRFHVPYFRNPEQQWGATLLYREDETDAYDYQSLEAGTWMSRTIGSSLTLKGGPTIQYLEEYRDDATSLYYLLSLPSSVTWDRSRNRLDPRRGFRLVLETEPFQSLEQGDLFFWKNLATLNLYLPIDRQRRWVAAFRFTGGNIAGASLDSVPGDVRFYAGGGASVRGYEYQSVSPREDDTITGGLSLLETSVELRAQLTDRFGIVVFIDGGAAFADHIPENVEEAMQWGAGVGFRYYTQVGPIRADAGFPLDRRDGIDEAWQFYISIGQAF